MRITTSYFDGLQLLTVVTQDSVDNEPSSSKSKMTVGKAVVNSRGYTTFPPDINSSVVDENGYHDVRRG